MKKRTSFIANSFIKIKTNYNYEIITSVLFISIKILKRQVHFSAKKKTHAYKEPLKHSQKILIVKSMDFNIVAQKLVCLFIATMKLFKCPCIIRYESAIIV